MATHKLFFYFVLLAFSAGVKSTEVNRCNDNSTLPELVEITNCDRPPCILYINTNNSMTMGFKSPRYLEKIGPSALAHLMGLPPIPYPLGQDDACDGITNTPCPIAEGEYVEYTYGMFILPIFPPASLTLEFSLVDKDQDSKRIECFKVDMELKRLP